MGKSISDLIREYDKNEAAMLKRIEAILERHDSTEMHARNAATEVMNTFLRGAPEDRQELED